MQTTFSISFCMKIDAVRFKFLLAFVLNGLIDNNLTLVQIMAWRRIGDKPLSLSIVTLFTDSYIRYSASMGQISSIHDDVIKWKHFPRNWPFVREIHRSRWILHTKWRGALMFSLICVWINGWVNNGEAGDLRRHRGHYDVIVMFNWKLSFVDYNFLTLV